MPIQGYFSKEKWQYINSDSIPWEMIASHEAQAQINHQQSLTRLAERGGVSECEAIAILENRRWRRMGEVEARNKLREMIKEYGRR